MFQRVFLKDQRPKLQLQNHVHKVHDEVQRHEKLADSPRTPRPRTPSKAATSSNSQAREDRERSRSRSKTRTETAVTTTATVEDFRDVFHAERTEEVTEELLAFTASRIPGLPMARKFSNRNKKLEEAGKT